MELSERIKEQLSDFRYKHTISVAKECEKLSDIFCLNGIELKISALLHDISKEISTEEQIALCEKYGIPLSSDDLKSPKTLHALSAEAVIYEKYTEFSDYEIIQNIRTHSTGKENMTLCQKLLFLADYIEETRKYDDCIEIRNFFYSGITEDKEKNLIHLDNTVVLCLAKTIEELTKNKSFIHPNTVSAYNFLVNNLE